MSSFQSFKSFMKIQQNPNNQGQKKVSGLYTKLSNQKGDDQNSSIQMAVNENSEKGQRRVKRQGTVYNFISKVYSMLEEKQIRHIVSWSHKQSFYSKVEDIQSKRQKNSDSFEILDLQKFEEVVLPKYFKHSNMSSFVRQLNMYGFHKLRGSKNSYEFQHEKFQRNSKDKLSQIRRKTPDFMGIASANFITNVPKDSINFQRTNQDRNEPIIDRLAQTQQQLCYGEQVSEDNIFPTESLVPLKKISLEEKVDLQAENSLEKQKLRKLELIEEENNRLKAIKASKLQKIKDLNSISRQKMETKFAKILFSCITVKLQTQYKNAKLSKQLDLNYQTQDPKSATLNIFADHIISNAQPETFETYHIKIKSLLSNKNKPKLNE